MSFLDSSAQALVDTLSAGPYNVAVVLALLLGATLAFRQGRRAGLDASTLVLLIGGVALASVIGSKFLFFDLSAPEVGKKSNLGAIAAGMAAAVLLTRAVRVSLGRLLDVLTTPALAGMALGRVGCFLAECCGGTATTVPWAVHPDGDHASGVHPVQLYEAAGDLLLIGLLIRLTPPGLVHASDRPGRRFQLGLLGYSALRFATEFVREGRTTAGGLNSVQWVLLAVIAAVGTLVWRESRAAAATTRQPHAVRPVIGGVDHRVAWTTIGVTAIGLASVAFAPASYTPLEALLVRAMAAAVPLGVLLASPARRRLAWRTRLVLPSLGAFLLFQRPDSTGRPRDEILFGSAFFTGSHTNILAERMVDYTDACDGSARTRIVRTTGRRRTMTGALGAGWRHAFDADSRLTLDGALLFGRNSQVSPPLDPEPTGLNALGGYPPSRVSLFGGAANAAFEGREGDVELTLVHGSLVDSALARRVTLASVTGRLGTRGGVYLEAHLADAGHLDDPKAYETTGDVSYLGLGYTLGLRRPRIMLGLGLGNSVVGNLQIPTERVELNVTIRSAHEVSTRIESGTSLTAGVRYRVRR